MNVAGERHKEFTDATSHIAAEAGSSKCLEITIEARQSNGIDSLFEVCRIASVLRVQLANVGARSPLNPS
jgi:hypothetical protein